MTYGDEYYAAKAGLLAGRDTAAQQQTQAGRAGKFGELRQDDYRQDAETKRRGVQIALEELQKSIDRCHAISAALTERLRPVVRPIPETAEGNHTAGSNRAEGCQLEEWILGLSASLNTHTRSLENLMSSLEI